MTFVEESIIYPLNASIGTLKPSRLF